MPRLYPKAFVDRDGRTTVTGGAGWDPGTSRRGFRTSPERPCYREVFGDRRSRLALPAVCPGPMTVSRRETGGWDGPDSAVDARMTPILAALRGSSEVAGDVRCLGWRRGGGGLLTVASWLKGGGALLGGIAVSRRN